MPNDQLEKLFSALWSDLENHILSIQKGAAAAKHNRPQGEILEELVSIVRTVEMRVRDAMDDDPSIRRRRRMRFHPEMMQMMMHRVAEGPRDPVQILFVAGLLRDDAPWLYELALEAYRSIRAGRKQEGQKSLRRFRDALELLQRGPFFDELGFDKMTLKMIRSDFFEMFEFMDFAEIEEGAENLGGRGKRLPPENKIP